MRSVDPKPKTRQPRARGAGGRSRLSVRDVYGIWASSYPPFAHNPVMRAEQAAMLSQWPDVRGAHALDLACGTGRYAGILGERGARRVVALDFSAEMLARAPAPMRVLASMSRLPLADAAFDLVVSGLAVGHADDLRRWMRECARVLRIGGRLLFSDFHPAAAQAGMTRSFRAADGRTYAVPHRVFTPEDYHSAARDAGLAVESIVEVRAGVELNEPFDGSEEFYLRWHGTPIVLVARMKRL